MLFLKKTRLTLVTLLLQGISMTIILAVYLHLPSQPTASSSPVVEQGKVHVLLLSSWRSGSSFLGQVFGQHPSVFYLMEPAWHVWMTLGMPGARGLRMAVRDLLRQVLQCDLSVMTSYLPKEANVSNLFVWSHSRALCSPPVCSLTPRNAFSDKAKCAEHCGSPGLAKAEEACRNYTHVVLKEVRLFELESLYPLLRDPSLDLRIVHLVRDPRAVLCSREQVYDSLFLDSALVLGEGNGKGPEVQYRVMQEVCRSHIRMHDTGLLTPPKYLEGRYRMVRYEDLIQDPVAQVKAIYNFTGLEMTQELQDWIYRLTNGKGTKKYAFDTNSRNSKEMSRAWRTTLPYEKVQRIQQVCKEAMSLLGYRTLHSEEEQRNLDLDVLLPREPWNFTWLPSKSKNSTKA